VDSRGRFSRAALFVGEYNAMRRHLGGQWGRHWGNRFL
jgi:hypothetical protein